MPRDLDLVAVEMTKSGSTFRARETSQGSLLTRSLASVTAYKARFGGIFEDFHPNEILAVLFATMLAKDSFGGRGLPAPSEAAGKDFAKLRAWCSKHLASTAAVSGR